MNKPPAPFHLTPDHHGLIHLAAAYTPTNHIHTPDSTYVRWYWLTDLGPTTYLAWTSLTLWLPTTDHATVPLAYTELAHSLGTAPGRLTRALSRLAAYHLAHTLHDQPHTLYIKRAAPNLSPANAPDSPNAAPPSPQNTNDSTPPDLQAVTNQTRPPDHPAASTRPAHFGPHRARAHRRPPTMRDPIAQRPSSRPQPVGPLYKSTSFPDAETRSRLHGKNPRRARLTPIRKIRLHTGRWAMPTSAGRGLSLVLVILSSMAHGELFPTPTSERLGPLGNTEPPVHWYTESTRPEADTSRALINAWYSEVIDPEGRLAARLRSENTVDHYQAIDELLAHRLLRARSRDIRYEEDGRGPDFRVYRDGALEAAIEVVSLFDSDAWTAGQRHADRLIDELNRRLGPAREWFIGIEGDQDEFPQTPVPARRCAEFLRAVLESLSVDDRVQAIAGSYPIRTFTFDGGSIRFMFMPRSTGLDEADVPDDRVIGFGPSRGGMVDVGVRLRKRVAKKRYDLPPSTPYLVFAVIHDTLGDDWDVMNALYGSSAIDVATGRSLRLADGTFGLERRGGELTPRNSRISAVSAVTRFLPWDIAQLDVAIYENPYAASPWGAVLPCTRRFAPGDGVPNWIEGDFEDLRALLVAA